ncbi:IS3 family transposase, partial [Escherichia coli]
PLTDFGGKTSIFSHPVYLFLREFSLQDFRGGSLIRSMSRKGCSPDNAACEGFFGRLKTEMYHGRKWSGITPEKFMQQVDTYIRWYNERRIKLSPGAVSPKMYRQQCGLE